MPIHNAVHTLSNTTPTLVVPRHSMEQEVQLHNMEKGNNKYIHLGDSNVSTSNSIHIDPGETTILHLGPSDELYAVSDPNGLELGVLRITQD